MKKNIFWSSIASFSIICMPLNSVMTENVRSSNCKTCEDASSLERLSIISNNKLLLDNSIKEINSSLSETNQSIKYIAQITNPPPEKPTAFSSLNLNNPTSPAAKIIGVSVENIPTISTPNQFGIEVLNGLDNNGNFNTGINVDTLPYVLIRGNDFTLEDYQNSYFQRLLANTKLSIATTKADDSTNTARAALGVEFVLLNQGDPRMNKQYTKKLGEIQKDIIDQINPETPANKIQEIAKKGSPEKRMAEAKKEAEREAGQGEMWTLAFGQSWLSPTGRYSDLSGEGMGFWTTYRTGLGGNSQLLLHASLRNAERVKDNQGGFVNADTIVGGVRFQSGNRDFRFSLETAYNRESQGGQRINDYLSFGLGVEPRIFDNSWLALSFGGSTGRENGTDFQFKTGIKWDINPGYIEKKVDK